MKKTVMPYIFSLIVLFSIIANTPIQSVKASEIDTNSTVQQKYISAYKVSGFSNYPPQTYLYNDGKFKGWLTLEDAYAVGTKYTGIYAGYVYYPFYPDKP